MKAWINCKLKYLIETGVDCYINPGLKKIDQRYSDEYVEWLEVMVTNLAMDTEELERMKQEAWIKNYKTNTNKD